MQSSSNFSPRKAVTKNMKTKLSLEIFEGLGFELLVFVVLVVRIFVFEVLDLRS